MRQFQTRLPKGKVVRDRYVIEDLLGQGGFVLFVLLGGGISATA